MMNKLGYVLTSLVLIGGCEKILPTQGAAKGPAYRTATISRQDVVSTVSAVGTVTPRNTATGIPVGAQVNGKITHLYVDYNDTVTNNQAVAEIDPQVYEAEYKSAVARLHVSEAGVEEATCTLDSRRAELVLAEKTYARKKKLTEKSVAPMADLDSAEETFEKARLAVASAQAQLRSAEANVEASRAAVDQAKANLDYCTIRSPVNGIVIDRKVEFGETVVSSMNAVPVLTIAEDLDVIWISADIPEADIGAIAVGQRVTFTVDAYRENGRLRTFTGTVRQVRKASTTTNNVVTFPVVVEAENPGRVLFPGMTATLTIETRRAEQALVVASAAFRFEPKDVEAAQEASSTGARIWLVPTTPNAPLEAVEVVEGATDAAVTEILGDRVAELEGRKAVLGYQVQRLAESASDEAENPFMPKPPKKGK